MIESCYMRNIEASMLQLKSPKKSDLFISVQSICCLPIQPCFPKGENGESLKCEVNESLKIFIFGSRLLMLRWATAMRDASKLRLRILLFTEEKKLSSGMG